MTKINIMQDIQDKEEKKEKDRLIKEDERRQNLKDIISPSNVTYNRDINVDGSISEYYEGSVDDIIKLKGTISLEEDSDIIYDYEDAVNFIYKDLDVKVADETLIRAVLNADERYMISIGLIKE